MLEILCELLTVPLKQGIGPDLLLLDCEHYWFSLGTGMDN